MEQAPEEAAAPVPWSVLIPAVCVPNVTNALGPVVRVLARTPVYPALHEAARRLLLRPVVRVPSDNFKACLLDEVLLPALPDNDCSYSFLEAVVDAAVVPLCPPKLVDIVGDLSWAEYFLPVLQRARLFQPQTFMPCIMDLDLWARREKMLLLARLLRFWCSLGPVFMTPHDVDQALAKLAAVEALGDFFDVSWVRARFDQVSGDRVFGLLN